MSKLVLLSWRRTHIYKQSAPAISMAGADSCFFGVIAALYSVGLSVSVFVVLRFVSTCSR